MFARLDRSTVQTLSCYSVPKHSHLDVHIERTLLLAAAHGFHAYFWEWSKRLNYAAFVAERSAMASSGLSGGVSAAAAVSVVDVGHALQMHGLVLGCSVLVCAAERLYKRFRP